MKKASLLLLSLVMFFTFQVGSVFAETPLSSVITGLLGTKYKYGGSTTEGFDCSGFTRYVFAQFGIELSRQSKTQNEEGYWIDKKDLRAGDLVFFNTDGKGVSHVGIFVGAGKFAHSATNEGVTITDLDDKYYAKRYVSARRVLTDEKYAELMAEPSGDATQTAQN